MRRMLTVSDRAEIASGMKAGWSVRAIATLIDRAPSVVSREIRRNALASGRYALVHADCQAGRARRRPQERKVAADEVLRAGGAGRSWPFAHPASDRRSLTLGSPGRHRGLDESVQGRTVSHEAIYQYIYALPKGELAAHGILLRSKRTRPRPAPTSARRGAPIVAMTSIDAREDIADRKVRGHWEGDLIIGAHGKGAAATLVERTTRFTVILGLSYGKDAEYLADALIDHVSALPEMMRKTLTWDQGSQMAKHAALTLATDMPVYFAHPRSPWERPTNENTNGLIREYLPKGTHITNHQPYLTAIAEELNERPRAILGYLTPLEALEKLLVASTP